MTINIKIKPSERFADVSLTDVNTKTTKVKKVLLPDLFGLLNNLTSGEKDTGYIPSNLLRERVRQSSARAYYIKEFETDLEYTGRRRADVKTNNLPEGVTYESGKLVFKNFKFRNILAFINNSNTDSFNPSFYKIYNAVPSITGVVDDNTTITQMFTNQFSENICWPENFDKKILSNRNPTIQSAFVTQYLSSKFNSDLFPNAMRYDDLGGHRDEFRTFVLSILDYPSDTTLDALTSHDQVILFFLGYYFLSNVKNINPAVYSRSENRTTLGAVFSNHSS